MHKPNPIDFGIYMADRMLAAFNVAGTRGSLEQGVAASSLTQPHQPSPDYSLMTRPELSVLQEDINEAQARLDTQNTLEQAHRDILVSQYAMLAYCATRCRDRLATRQWIQVPTEEAIAMSKAEVDLCTASSNHDDMIDAIAELRTTIRQAQAKFDAIARRNGGAA